MPISLRSPCDLRAISAPSQVGESRDYDVSFLRVGRAGLTPAALGNSDTCALGHLPPSPPSAKCMHPAPSIYRYALTLSAPATIDISLERPSAKWVPIVKRHTLAALMGLYVIKGEAAGVPIRSPSAVMAGWIHEPSMSLP